MDATNNARDTTDCDMRSLESPAVKAVQEQQKMIEELKKEIDPPPFGVPRCELGFYLRYAFGTPGSVHAWGAGGR
jgi:hypothetical protein